MKLQVAYPHIDTAPGESPRLRRSPRIRVAQIVMDYLAHGWSVEEMCRQHVNLTPAEVHAAMAFYFDHQTAIDAEIKAEWEELAKHRDPAPRSPFFMRMRAKGLL